MLDKLIKFIGILMTVFLLIFSLNIIKSLLYSSDIPVIDYIRSCGAFSAIIFVLLQIIQVIFPIIPGGASCLVGVIVFGPLKGFIYNYIGLSIGSIIVFGLSRKYGLTLVEKIFSKKTILKYQKYLNYKNYYKLFLWGILLPGAPYDLLCYLSGLTNITYKKFISIILTCKPVTLICYSIGWYYFPDFIKLFI